MKSTQKQLKQYIDRDLFLKLLFPILQEYKHFAPKFYETAGVANFLNSVKAYNNSIKLLFFYFNLIFLLLLSFSFFVIFNENNFSFNLPQNNIFFLIISISTYFAFLLFWKIYFSFHIRKYKRYYRKLIPLHNHKFSTEQIVYSVMKNSEFKNFVINHIHTSSYKQIFSRTIYISTIEDQTQDLIDVFLSLHLLADSFSIQNFNHPQKSS